MRVLVCSDTIGSMSSAEAGRAIAGGWSFAEVAVRPAGVAGAGFVAATADRFGVQLTTATVDGRLVTLAAGSDAVALALPAAPVHGPIPYGPIPYRSSSLALGRAVREAVVSHRPATIFVDLVGGDVHDGGAGFLAGLGATADAPLTDGVAGLGRIARVDLFEPRRLLTGVRLVGVVPADQRDQALLGLRGITAARGRASGEDPARLLAADADLAAFADLLTPGGEAGIPPGAGACGGVGLVVLALGGRLATGPEIALGGVTGRYDLVVSGCSVFDFASRGGGVVAEAAAVATAQLCPCVVIAGEVLIGSREMRTMGIEVAYAVRQSTADRPSGGDVTSDDLVPVAARVARSWRW